MRTGVPRLSCRRPRALYGERAELSFVRRAISTRAILRGRSVSQRATSRPCDYVSENPSCETVTWAEEAARYGAQDVSPLPVTSGQDPNGSDWLCSAGGKLGVFGNPKVSADGHRA